MVDALAAGVHVQVVDSSAVEIQIQVAAALVAASRPTLQISSRLEGTDLLGAEAVASLKEVWRGADAKALLTLSTAVADGHTVLKDILSATSRNDDVAKLDVIHNDKIADVNRSSGMLGLAQAMYKTLKSGESRAAIVNAVIAGLDRDAVSISPALRLHITLVTGVAA